MPQTRTPEAGVFQARLKQKAPWPRKCSVLQAVGQEYVLSPFVPLNTAAPPVSSSQGHRCQQQPQGAAYQTEAGSPIKGLHDGTTTPLVFSGGEGEESQTAAELPHRALPHGKPPSNY